MERDSKRSPRQADRATGTWTDEAMRNALPCPLPEVPAPEPSKPAIPRPDPTDDRPGTVSGNRPRR